MPTLSPKVKAPMFWQ